MICIQLNSSTDDHVIRLSVAHVVLQSGRRIIAEMIMFDKQLQSIFLRKYFNYIIIMINANTFRSVELFRLIY